jgi:membrane-associated PAP2 superfamily phosphatase
VSLWTFLLGHLIPGDHAGAGFAATMLSFLLYAGCFVWVFGARRLGRTALIIAALAAVATLGIALT